MRRKPVNTSSACPWEATGDNLPVRQADDLARQVDFDELLVLLHQPNRPGKHVIEPAAL